MRPVKLKIIEKKNLFIKWDDGDESSISLQKLRTLCPCATCMSLRESQSKNYVPIYNENQTTIAGIEEVGTYAVAIKWKDGHNTGIYEYPFLKNLAKD
jgi:DUF971 family protein